MTANESSPREGKDPAAEYSPITDLRYPAKIRGREPTSDVSVRASPSLVDGVDGALEPATQLVISVDNAIVALRLSPEEVDSVVGELEHASTEAVQICDLQEAGDDE